MENNAVLDRLPPTVQFFSTIWARIKVSLQFVYTREEGSGLVSDVNGFLWMGLSKKKIENPKVGEPYK